MRITLVLQESVGARGGMHQSLNVCDHWKHGDRESRDEAQQQAASSNAINLWG